MRVLIENESSYKDINEADVIKCAELAMASLELPDSTELSVSFVDDDEMAKLNEEYRQKSGPTDVLSFECDMLDDDFPSPPSTEGEFSLGDVIIAPYVAEKQAKELGHSFETEVRTLLVHGILHLCGYDHIEDDDAAVMQIKQDELLKSLGSSDAHAESHTQSTEGEEVGFVRHAHDTTPFPLAKAFKCAATGIGYTWRTQRNIKIQTAIGILAIVLGFVLQISTTSWCAIVICIALVISLEIVNTAIESVVDMASPDWHKLAMHAKDCGAGAVYIAAMASLVIAALVYIPAFIDLITR